MTGLEMLLKSFGVDATAFRQTGEAVAAAVSETHGIMLKMSDQLDRIESVLLQMRGGPDITEFEQLCLAHSRKPEEASDGR